MVISIVKEDKEVSRVSKGIVCKTTGKEVWCGIASLLDGYIEEAYSYEEAEQYDFHHSMYCTPVGCQRLEDGESVFFWVHKGIVRADWDCPLDENIMRQRQEIARKVETQLRGGDWYEDTKSYS